MLQPERNHDFAAWSRSTSFSISLSERAITEILLLQHYCKDNTETRERGLILNRMSAGYVTRKGLARRSREEGYGGTYVLTEAGKAVATLLRCAGFTLPIDEEPKQCQP